MKLTLILLIYKGIIWVQKCAQKNKGIIF